MTCDHNTIRECLCLWFGSVQQFEEIMRDRVFHVFKGSSGRQSIPYLWILATRVPNLWSGIWLAVQTAYWSDIATTAAMTFLLLGTWLVTVPLWLRVLQLGMAPQPGRVKPPHLQVPVCSTYLYILNPRSLSPRKPPNPVVVAL